MRVPSFERFRKGMQATAFFVCGMVVGAAVYSGLVLDQTNRIVEDNIQLKEQLDLAEKKISQREQSGQGETVIRNIVAYVVKGKQELDAVAEAQLKEDLKEDLRSTFIGRKIYSIGSDAQLTRSLLEGKIYPNIEKKDYRISVKTMLAVDGTLYVWVEANLLLRK